MIQETTTSELPGLLGPPEKFTTLSPQAAHKWVEATTLSLFRTAEVLSVRGSVALCAF
jgi:hypothetical protein